MDAEIEFIRSSWLARAKLMHKRGHEWHSWMALMIWGALGAGGEL